VTLSSVSAISAMVAPVVLITTGALLSNGLLVIYGATNDRMREMTRERLEIRTGPTGNLLSAAECTPAGRERLTEINHQLPLILRRHRLTRYAVLLTYSAIGVLVLSVIGIAVAVTRHSETFARTALGLVLAGTVVMLAGLLMASRSLAESADAISWAVKRTGSAGLRVRLGCQAGNAAGIGETQPAGKERTCPTISAPLALRRQATIRGWT
jgi:Protein of unknown function (DUF2721)